MLYEIFYLFFFFLMIEENEKVQNILKGILLLGQYNGCLWKYYYDPP